MKLKYITIHDKTFLVEEDGTTFCQIFVPVHTSAETTAKDIVRMYNKGLTVAKDDLTDDQSLALASLNCALYAAANTGLLVQMEGAYLSPIDINTFCAGVGEMCAANKEG